MTTTDSPSYTKTAIVLHWLIALAIIFMLALGWSFDSFSGETKFAMIQLHKSIGITILLLSLARLGWRLTHHAPPLPTNMPVWEQKAAHLGHILLYIAMIGVPLSGWAMVSASPRNIPTILYGIVPWPNFPIVSTLDNKKEVSNLLGWLHGNAALMLALLAGGHALAALKHHFVDRDDVLLRMLPRPCAKALNRLRGASMRLFLLLFLFAFAFPGAASAADWQIDPAHSKLGFTGTQNGEKFDGGFKKFDAQISLDPDHPETGHIAVTVDMTTAYAGSDDRDQMLPQAAWFDSKKFPQAHFVSTAIRKTGNARYEADATLTIKGITRNVLLPFTLAPEGDHWRAQGTTQLIRSDFQIGQGSFSSEAYVKHAVDVAIDLAAKPLP